jgi:endonuclease/exonuclease/phosphatase family metal-dependent hydrolase
VGCLALLWFLETVLADDFWLTTPLTYAPQWPFGLPTVALLAASIRFRNGRLSGLNGAAAILFLFVFMGWCVPLSRPHPSGQILRLMTFNIKHGIRGEDGLVDVIRREKPDIACIQMADGYQGYQTFSVAGMAHLADYHFFWGGENLILSRYPIRTYVPPLASRAGLARPAMMASVDFSGQTLTLINLHMAKSRNGDTLLDHHASIQDYFEETADIRLEQTSALLDWAYSIQGPLILCGDFNNPPRGRCYEQLRGVFHDAFAEVGCGFGYSYPADLPMMRIDFVFTTNGVVPLTAQVLHEDVSDHQPLECTLAIPPLGGANAKLTTAAHTMNALKS